MVNLLGYKQYTSILNQEHPDSDNNFCFLMQLKMKSRDGYRTQTWRRNWKSNTNLKGCNLVTSSPKLMNGIANLSPEILLTDIYQSKTRGKTEKEVSF